MTLAPIYIYSVESYYYSYVVRAVYYSTKRFKLSVLFIYIDDQAYRKDDKSCRNLLKLLMVWICGFARVSSSKSLKRRLIVSIGSTVDQTEFFSLFSIVLIDLWTEKTSKERERELERCSHVTGLSACLSRQAFLFFPLVLFGLVGVATHRERSIRDAIELNEPIYFPVYVFASYNSKAL